MPILTKQFFGRCLQHREQRQHLSCATTSEAPTSVLLLLVVATRRSAFRSAPRKTPRSCTVRHIRGERLLGSATPSSGDFRLSSQPQLCSPICLLLTLPRSKAVPIPTPIMTNHRSAAFLLLLVLPLMAPKSSLGFAPMPTQPAFLRSAVAVPSSALYAAVQAKNASELSHEELRDYRNAMSISRTNGDRQDVSRLLDASEDLLFERGIMA